jgi:RNA polymerase sigma factor (sigma-70 family)
MVTEVHNINEKEFNLRLEVRLKNAALVNAREELGFTAKKAAELIGVSYHPYIKYENMSKYPGPDMRRKICDFYGLEEEVVFPEELRKIMPGKRILERKIPKSRLVSLAEASHQHLLPPVEIEQELEEREMKEEIENVLGKLQDREAIIIRLYYGIGERESKTYDEIAEMLGMSRQRIRQIHNVALQKIRSGKIMYGGRVSPALGRHLEDYAENISR